MHFQGEIIIFFLKDEALRSESVNYPIDEMQLDVIIKLHPKYPNRISTRRSNQVVDPLVFVTGSFDRQFENE